MNNIFVSVSKVMMHILPTFCPINKGCRYVVLTPLLRLLLSGKKKGQRMAQFVRERCCNPSHVIVKERYCSHIELLAVRMHPCNLPSEFSSTTVYIHPSADAEGPAAWFTQPLQNSKWMINIDGDVTSRPCDGNSNAPQFNVTKPSSVSGPSLRMIHWNP